jgi:hypothetical protein
MPVAIPQGEMHSRLISMLRLLDLHISWFHLFVGDKLLTAPI